MRTESVWLLAALMVCACGGNDKKGSEEAETPQGVGATSAGTAHHSPTATGSRPSGGVHFDLMANAHLADVEHEGSLYVDLGSPAQSKYTNGRWNSGWGSTGVRDGATYAYLGSLGRVYFPWATSEAITLNIRLRPVGGPGMIMYLNNKEVIVPPITGKGYRDLKLNVDAEKVRAGENYLLMRGTKFKGVGGENVAFEVDSIWVTKQGTEAPKVAPFENHLLRAKSKMSFHVELPNDAQLYVKAKGKAGTLNVSVDPETGTTTNESLALESTVAKKIDLKSHGGKIARVTLSADSDIAVESLQIWSPTEGEVVPTPAKNVVVLLIDTLPAHHLQVYNPKSPVKSPAIDAFAKSGTVFNAGTSPENWTKPSVASILTSLQPHTHKAQGDASKLQSKFLMLSEVYKKSGFQTGSFIANGYVSDAFGFKQGWSHYTNYIREGKPTYAANVFKESMAWIEKNKDQRFFAYIQTIDPHVPYDVPDEYMEMYNKGYRGWVGDRCTDECLKKAKRGGSPEDIKQIKSLHYAEISYHDHFFGKFLARFKELGLDQNTVFVIVSDHGEEHGQHGGWGHGHSVYQDLLHVPLMVRWPGAVPAGRRVDAAVSTLDIGPTVLEATGVAIPEAFHGRSLLGHTWGAPPSGPWVAFSYFQDNRRVIRSKDWKLIMRKNMATTLFHLSADPGEKEELKPNNHPIAMRYLRILSGQYNGATNPKRWLEPNARLAKIKREREQQGDLNAETCAQLKALGYIPDGCK